MFAGLDEISLHLHVIFSFLINSEISNYDISKDPQVKVSREIELYSIGCAYLISGL